MRLRDVTLGDRALWARLRCDPVMWTEQKTSNCYRLPGRAGGPPYGLGGRLRRGGMRRVRQAAQAPGQSSTSTIFH